MSRALTITERGWPGHFICARYCRYHRNTLVSDGKKHIVISSVGNMHSPEAVRRIVRAKRNQPEEIGCDRYYETMVFPGYKDGPYIEASTGQQLETGECRWAITAKSTSKLPEDVDNLADAIHEENVRYVEKHWKRLISTHHAA